MNHPPDHRDDDDDDDALPPHLRRLLDEGGDGPALSRAAQERVLGRVLATVGVATVGAAGVASAATTGSATTTAVTTSAVAPTATVAAATTATVAATTATVAATTATVAATTATVAGGLAVSVKAAVLAAGVGLAGLTGVGVVAVVDRGPALPARDPAPLWSPPVSSSSSSSSSSSPSSPSSSSEAPAPEVAPAPHVASVPLPASSPPVASPSPLKKAVVATPAPESSWEVPQLESARAALSAGRAAEALALVEDHARRAPASALREEGRALAVLALAALGRREEATAAATAFAAQHPQSLFLPRVQRAVSSVSPTRGDH